MARVEYKIEEAPVRKYFNKSISLNQTNEVVVVLVRIYKNSNMLTDLT